MKYKSSAVRLISTGHSLTKSCDRLRRVQGLSKVVGKRSNDISSIDENDNNIITIRYPIGTICCKQRCLNLVVMFVEKIVNVRKKILAGLVEMHQKLLLLDDHSS